MNKNILILLTASLVGTHTWAGSVTVPNTFVDGTTASASEVNANFDAVKTAVDDNDSRITTNTGDINTNVANIAAITNAMPAIQLKDANGVFIGRVIGMRAISTPYVLTDQGYYTYIDLNVGKTSANWEMFYESTDCTGAPYALAELNNKGVVLVDRYNNIYSPLYVPKDAQSVTININSSSFFDGGITCIAENFPAHEAYPVFTNDPNITGIQNTAYPIPMLME